MGVNREMGLLVYSKNNLTLLIPERIIEDSITKLILVRE